MGDTFEPFEYTAFISYCHHDMAFAKWLQKKLESYNLPVKIRKEHPELPAKIRPIYRDQSDLSGGNLKEEIEKALEGSKFLIVICSPRAAQSPWVSKEVNYFIEHGRDKYIIPFIIGGEPNSYNPEECFPVGLRQLIQQKKIFEVNIDERGKETALKKLIDQMSYLSINEQLRKTLKRSNDLSNNAKKITEIKGKESLVLGSHIEIVNTTCNSDEENLAINGINENKNDLSNEREEIYFDVDSNEYESSLIDSPPSLFDVNGDCNELQDLELINDKQEDIISYYPHSNVQIIKDLLSSEIKCITSYSKNLFKHLLGADSASFLEEKTKELSTISTCVYAPSQITVNKTFITRVYFYLPYEIDIIDSKISIIEPNAIKKEYKSLDIPVKRGDRLSVELNFSEGVECKTKKKTIEWNNHYNDCSFSVKLVDPSIETIECEAVVFVNDMPAGEMVFTIDVVESKPKKIYTKVQSHRYSKIFISYSHKDESQVKGIAEGCKMLGTEYFFDRHSLQPGDIFKNNIFKFIDEADLFVLCWSKNAAVSEWVKIEREHALSLINNGKTSLSFYPLSLKPEAPLPVDIAKKYNFGKL